jgi:hypothetical protein
MMRLIGQKWKCGDTWSGLILIGRGLILIFLDLSLISRFSFERINDSFIHKGSIPLTKRNKKIEDGNCSMMERTDVRD